MSKFQFVFLTQNTISYIFFRFWDETRSFYDYATYIKSQSAQFLSNTEDVSVECVCHLCCASERWRLRAAGSGWGSRDSCPVI